MRLSKAGPHELLRRSAEEWREHALSTLAVKEIRHAIGEPKAKRLQSLAAKAGTIALHGSEIQASKSGNGLYLFPFHEGIPDHFTFRYRDKGTVRRFVMDGWNTGEAFHASSTSIPGFDIIGLPADTSVNAATAAEKRAKVVHELTHADQARRSPGEYPGETRQQEATRNEAEAYHDTLAVADYNWQGALSPLVALGTQEGDQGVIKTNDQATKDLLIRSPLVANSLGAVILNTLHGYSADGYSLATPELAAAYDWHDLLHREPDLQ